MKKCFFFLSAACANSNYTIKLERNITSPFYPNFYPNYQDCKWRISAGYKYIRFKFQDLVLSQGDMVTIGRVFEIRDNFICKLFIVNMVTIGRVFEIRDNFICKSFIVNKWLTLCQGSCDLTFTSDQQVTGKGFRVEVKFHEPPTG